MNVDNFFYNLSLFSQNNKPQLLFKNRRIKEKKKTNKKKLGRKICECCKNNFFYYYVKKCIIIRKGFTVQISLCRVCAYRCTAKQCKKCLRTDVHNKKK